MREKGKKCVIDGALRNEDIDPLAWGIHRSLEPADMAVSIFIPRALE